MITLCVGQTKLRYIGAKRLDEIDGYVFQTDWHGKAYPSKVFFSVHKELHGCLSWRSRFEAAVPSVAEPLDKFSEIIRSKHVRRIF
jgi:hypothetical protein